MRLYSPNAVKKGQILITATINQSNEFDLSE